MGFTNTGMRVVNHINRTYNYRLLGRRPQTPPGKKMDNYWLLSNHSSELWGIARGNNKKSQSRNKLERHNEIRLIPMRI
jgi:hypothetical protein